MSNAWSFSRISAYKTCPRQYQEVKLLNHFQETQHPTTAWGTKGHLALENRVRDGEPLPSEFSYLEGFARSIIALPGTTFCELELACTLDKAPTGFHDGAAWARGIVDVLKFHDTSAIILDYKFGNVKPSDQLKLMALLVFINFPTVQQVKTRFLWIAHRDKTDAVYHRRDAPALWASFEADAEQFRLAHENDVFPPRPSGLCKPSSKSGYAGCVVTTCEFCGKGGRYG